jgi:tyrosine decarboxylase/aspartate 1-decarboxylase
MIGVCPTSILRSQTKYASRNLADASDSEVIGMQDQLVDIFTRDILNLPKDFKHGFVLHSGTECNEVATFIHTKQSHRNIVILSTLTHSSIENACLKLNLQLIKLPINPSTLRVDNTLLHDTIQKYNERVLFVVLTYGTTKLGTEYDLEFSSDTDKLLKENDIKLHVDAAYGGTILSFLASKKSSWQAYLSLASITVDTHKFVGSLGCGLLILKNLEDKKHIGKNAIYFSGNSTALGTTRSAYPMATALACINHFGSIKMKLIAEECRKNANIIAEAMKKYGYELLCDIESGVVPIRLGSLKEVEYTLSKLHDLGYKVSPICIDNISSTIYGFRVVVTPKPQTRKAVLERFIKSFPIA